MTATCPTCRKLVTFTPRFAAWCCPLCTSLFMHQQAWIERDNAEWLRRQNIVEEQTRQRMMLSIRLGDEEADRRVRWAMLCQTGQAVLIGLIVAVALWWTR